MADLNPVVQPPPNPPAVQTYDFGRFRIDVGARHLLRDGEVMLLTSKAFETLLVLVTHRERAVTKDELMQAVWPNTFVSDDSLTQAISSVRRALGDAECIATIPRRGYKFIVPVTASPVEGDETHPQREPDHTSANGKSDARHTNGQKTESTTEVPLNTPEIAEPLAVAAEAPRTLIRLRTWWGPIVFLLTGAAAGWVIGANYLSRPARSESAALRFTQQAPAGTQIVSGGVLSPDGRYLAFVASDIKAGVAKLWVRLLTSTEPMSLSGTESAERPFWSPDSQSLGFVANGRLKTVSLRGENLRNLAGVRSFVAGAAWGPSLILFSNWRAGLDAVAPWGGPSSPMTTLDAAAGETQHRWPQFLPDGQHYLFYIASTIPERAGIYVGLTGSPDRTRLLDGSHEAAVYAHPNHLVYVRDGALMAQRFDPARLQLEGAPTTLDANVSAPGTRNTATVSAANGLLAYGGGTNVRRLTWFDRHGARLSTIDAPTALHSPAFSFDEKRLLAVSADAGHIGVWLLDLERGTPNRLIPDASMPMLSPDGTTVAFVAPHGAIVNDIYLRRIAGPAEDELLLRTGENKFINDWTRDGRYIIFASSNAKTGEDVWLLPTFGDRQPVPYLRSEFNEIQSRVSPDGKWLAYASNESGIWEVYVQSFPLPGDKQVISIRGGAEPVWRRDGRELYYLAEDRTLMAVQIEGVGKALKIGKPIPLFRLPVSGGLNHYRSHYAVAGDGKRFIVDAVDAQTQESITVISNWAALISR